MPAVAFAALARAVASRPRHATPESDVRPDDTTFSMRAGQAHRTAAHD